MTYKDINIKAKVTKKDLSKNNLVIPWYPQDWIWESCGYQNLLMLKHPTGNGTVPSALHRCRTCRYRPTE